MYSSTGSSEGFVLGFYRVVEKQHGLKSRLEQERDRLSDQELQALESKLLKVENQFKQMVDSQIWKKNLLRQPTPRV
jgi:hypothetical protein